MLLAADLHDHVDVARVLADDLAAINLQARVDEQAGTLLKRLDRVSSRVAAFLRDERTAGAAGDLAAIRTVLEERVVQQTRAARFGEELGADAEQTARRDLELDAHAAAAGIDHVGHLAASLLNLLHDRADVRLVDVDDESLVRLQRFPAGFLENDLRARQRELEGFAAHVLREDREVQLAAAAHFEAVGQIGLAHAKGDVLAQLALEALFDVARRDVLAFGAGERRIVHHPEHRDGGLVDGDGLEALRRVGGGEGLTDLDVREAGDGDDLSRRRLFDFLAQQSFEHRELRDAALLVRAVAENQDHVGALTDLSSLHTADAEAADVVVVVDGADEKLQGPFRVADRRRDALQNGVEQRTAVVVRVFERDADVAGAARRVEDREVDLLVRCTELDHEVEHFVDHFTGPCVGAIDLVDHDDRQKSEGQGLAQNETCLRHRTFGGVDEKDDAVDHRQDALDLAAEVGVTRRVDDVDLHFGGMDENRRQIMSGGGVSGLVMHRMSEGVRLVDLVTDRRVLGEDGDAALPLEVIGVHDALVHLLVGADGAGLLEESVDERGLPMVDVGDDGHIADVVTKLLHARVLTPAPSIIIRILNDSSDLRLLRIESRHPAGLPEGGSRAWQTVGGARHCPRLWRGQGGPDGRSRGRGPGRRRRGDRGHSPGALGP